MAAGGDVFAFGEVGGDGCGEGAACAVCAGDIDHGVGVACGCAFVPEYVDTVLATREVAAFE